MLTPLEDKGDRRTWYGQMKVIEILLIRRDEDGRGPVVNNRKDVEKSHQRHYETIDREQLWNCSDMCSVDYLGRTALHWAAISGDVDMIEAILSKANEAELKFLLNAKDSRERTALYWAAQKKFGRIVEYLSGYGDIRESEAVVVENCVFKLLDQEMHCLTAVEKDIGGIIWLIRTLVEDLKVSDNGNGLLCIVRHQCGSPKRWSDLCC
jgi:Ankyrin repeats (3 copies)